MKNLAWSYKPTRDISPGMNDITNFKLVERSGRLYLFFSMPNQIRQPFGVIELPFDAPQLKHFSCYDIKHVENNSLRQGLFGAVTNDNVYIMSVAIDSREGAPRVYVSDVLDINKLKEYSLTGTKAIYVGLYKEYQSGYGHRRQWGVTVLGNVSTRSFTIDENDFKAIISKTHKPLNQIRKHPYDLYWNAAGDYMNFMEDIVTINSDTGYGISLFKRDHLYIVWPHSGDNVVSRDEGIKTLAFISPIDDKTLVDVIEKRAKPFPFTTNYFISKSINHFFIPLPDKLLYLYRNNAVRSYSVTYDWKLPISSDNIKKVGIIYPNRNVAYDAIGIHLLTKDGRVFVSGSNMHNCLGLKGTNIQLDIRKEWKELKYDEPVKDIICPNDTTIGILHLTDKGKLYYMGQCNRKLVAKFIPPLGKKANILSKTLIAEGIKDVIFCGYTVDGAFLLAEDENGGYRMLYGDKKDINKDTTNFPILYNPLQDDYSAVQSMQNPSKQMLSICV